MQEEEERQIRLYAETLNKTAFKLVTLLNEIDIRIQERRSNIIVMTPRRKRPKEGCIIQRKDGRYEGRYMSSGKQRSVYSRDYNECLDRLEKAIAVRDECAREYTLLSWLREFVQVYKLGEVDDKTYRQMLRDIELHVEPHVGTDKALLEYKPIELQKILLEVATDRKREDIRNLFSGAFKQACSERLINYNPMLGVKSYKSERDKGIALTVKEQTAFIKAIAGTRLESYYLFCLYTGCRRSEALDVCREDIDESRNIIHIPGTKTKLSDRYIPLFAGVRALLPKLPKSGKLFKYSGDYVTRKFCLYCEKHTLKNLRHTFATRALEAGVPLKVVQVWLGHSKIDTTADVYSDVTRELSLDEAVKLDKIFGIT